MMKPTVGVCTYIILAVNIDPAAQGDRIWDSHITVTDSFIGQELRLDGD